MRAALRIAFAASMAMAGAALAQDVRKSGFDFMGRDTQAMQRDDTSNPGMLAALTGATLWGAHVGPQQKSCGDCHGDATQSMKGVAARYPAWDEASGAPVDLQGRINICRTKKQGVEPFAYESRDLLALTTLIGRQSRDMPIAPPDDTRLTPARERGAAMFSRRMGQLNLSCAQCHDDLAGKHIGSAVIPQAHPTGYPIYRLEWQSVGSLQRRLRNCMSGVRADPYPFGAAEFVELELFLMQRAAGMPVETPAVRP